MNINLKKIKTSKQNQNKTKERITIKANQLTNQEAYRLFQPGCDMNLILILQSYLFSVSKMVKDS